MSEEKSNTPKWILVTTGVIGIVSAIFVAVTKYYEIHKARAEALKAQIEIRIDAPVRHIQAEPPFDKYLRANPILYSDVQCVPYGSFSKARPGGQTQYDLNVSYPLDVTRKRQARTLVACQAKKVLEAQ